MAKNPNGPIDINIGQRMRRRRKLLRMTQQDLAQAVGIRFQQIQKYESGANKTSASRLFEIGEALDVPITYFYEGLDRVGAPTVSESASIPEDILSKPETLKLVSGYYQIGERVRARILAMVTSLDPSNKEQPE